MNPQKLGRYELIRVLGKGAMGLVYEGRDPNLDRRVAIKTIKVENLTSDEAAEYEIRFRTEARSAARLQHPNIVSVYDSDRDGDIAYLVMEFIQGQDLKHYLDQGERYTLQQAASIMNDLLSALGYAHSQAIVHRDIKPANLLIETGGRIKLTDFGVARIQDSGEATRTKGTMVGTLKYMSPEQVHGLPIDARSDLFSAGIVLYQLLTGARPFDGTSDYEIIQKIIEQPAQPPSSYNPLLPPAIDQVIARALEKRREDRYPDAQEFNAALQAAAMSAGDPTITPPQSAARPADSSTWTSTVIKGESLVNTSSGSLSGVPSSTVTQEVELVYWKDIKDSTDAEDFQDFLLKFPTGIYSDLARRRIKRLTHAGEHGGSRSSTSTGTRTRWPTPAAPAPGAEDPTLKVGATPQPAGADTFEATRMLAPADGPDAAPAAASGRKRGWMYGGVGLAVAAALVLGYLGYTRQPRPEATTPAATNAPSPTIVGHPSPAEKPQVPTASTPRNTGDKARNADATAAKKTTSPAAKPGAAPTSSPATGAAANDPRQVCEGRVLLGYLNCLKEQCEKPRYTQHQVCVDRRTMERRSQESL